MMNIYRDVAAVGYHNDMPDRSFHYARVAFDWSSSRRKMADACRAPSMHWSMDRTILAVYVISADDKPYSKIGIAEHPQGRCDGLQTANWDRLRVRYSLWVWDGKAKDVEQRSLALTRERGIEVRGEWVLLRPDEAFDLILDAAIELGVDAGDVGALGLTDEQIVASRAQSRACIERQEKQKRAALMGY